MIRLLCGYLLRGVGLTLVLIVCAAQASGADEIAVCAVNQLGMGETFACGPLKFRFHSASQCLPLRTPELDGVDFSNRNCASVQRACLEIDGDATAGAEAFNKVCDDDIATVANKASAAERAVGDKLDTDYNETIESVVVRADLITVRSLEGSCVLQAAGCVYSERNFHWLRRVERPLLAEDLFNTTRKTWAPELKSLFEQEILSGQGKPHDRAFPDGSCLVENSDSPDRWRFEKDGLAVRIMGKFDCGSNTGGGVVVIKWNQLRVLLRSGPLVGLTGPSPEPCKKDQACID